MEYEEQLKQAERIIDKLNAGKEPSPELEERINVLEKDLTFLWILSTVEGLVIVAYALAFLRLLIGG